MPSSPLKRNINYWEKNCIFLLSVARHERQWTNLSEGDSVVSDGDSCDSTVNDGDSVGDGDSVSDGDSTVSDGDSVGDGEFGRLLVVHLTVRMFAATLSVTDLCIDGVVAWQPPLTGALGGVTVGVG